MSARGQDVLLGSMLGLLVGALPGLLAAGAFVTWRLGGDLGQLELATYLSLLPATALGDWPFRTGALIGLGVALASAVAGVALCWREELSSHGTARWAGSWELWRAGLLARRLREARGPIWGKLGSPRSWAPCLSSRDIVHSLVAAPTRAGKGIGVVIPTLLSYPGSTVVLDVKGENYAKTARRRQQLGDRVFKFSPYAPYRRSHRYNPFDEITAAPERRRFAGALRIAGSLLDVKPGFEGWIAGCREIFTAWWRWGAARRPSPPIRSATLIA